MWNWDAKWIPTVNLLMSFVLFGLLITLLVRGNNRGDQITESLQDIQKVLVILATPPAT